MCQTGCGPSKAGVPTVVPTVGAQASQQRSPNQVWVTPREREAVLDRPKPPCWSPISSRPSSLASFSLPSSPLVGCAHSIRPAVLPATGWPLSNLTLEDSAASERREEVRHEGARAPQAQPGLEPDGFSDLPRTGHASAGRSEVNSAQTSTDGARLSGQE